MVNNFEQHTVLTQAFGSHQHTLQSFKNTFLSRNLDQNMHKNAYIFWKKKKTGKISAALGAPPTHRVVPPITCYISFLGSTHVITIEMEQNLLRNSNNVLLLTLISYFFATDSDFSLSLQLRPILSHTWVTISGPLIHPWLKPLVTPLAVLAYILKDEVELYIYSLLKQEYC